jgi:hypothetical protein
LNHVIGGARLSCGLRDIKDFEEVRQFGRENPDSARAVSFERGPGE